MKVFFINDIYKINVPDNATNERAQLYFKKNNTCNQKVYGLKWKPILFREMRIFTYLLLKMTLVKLPTLYNYWCKSPAVSGPLIYSRKIISRDIFLQILKFLRFDKSSAFIKRKPWPKLNSFIKCIREKFRQLVDPKTNIAIDESLMPCKWKLYIRRYIPKKILVLASSSPKLQGYTCDFILDYGKDNFKIPDCNLKISERNLILVIRL